MGFDTRPVTPADRFPPAPAYRDVWATVLFVLTVALFVALAGWALVMQIVKPTSFSEVFNDGDDFTEQRLIATVSAIAAATVVGTVIAVAWIASLRTFPKTTMAAAAVLNVLVWGAVTVLNFVLGQLVVGIIMAVITLLVAFAFGIMLLRLPFAAAILHAVTDSIDSRPSLYLVSALSIPLSVAVYLAMTAALVVVTLQLGALISSPAPIYVSYLFFVFVFLWIIQLIRGVVHTTIAGVVGFNYFNPGATSDAGVHPTVASLRRALTTSFGSIVLGSLLVAMVETFRALVNSLKRLNSTIRLVVDLILNCIDSLLRYFNHYVYTYCALYGVGYWRAAVCVFNLLEKTGFQQLVSDSWIGVALWAGIFLTAVASAGTAASVIALWPHGLTGIDWAIAIVASVIFGSAIATVAGEVIWSGTAAMFVCFAEHPEVMLMQRPDLYHMIHARFRTCKVFSRSHHHNSDHVVVHAAAPPAAATAGGYAAPPGYAAVPTAGPAYAYGPVPLTDEHTPLAGPRNVQGYQ